MPVCPQCLSREMVKFGKRDNQQRWNCRNCGLTTLYPLRRMPYRRRTKRKIK